MEQRHITLVTSPVANRRLRLLLALGAFIAIPLIGLAVWSVFHVRSMVATPVAETFTGEVTLRNWKLIGPIALASTATTSNTGGFESDYLSQLGTPEATADYAQFQGLCSRHPWLCRTYAGDGSVVPLFRYFSSNPQSVVYAIGTVSCKEDMSAILEVGSSEGIVAYVNGKVVISVLIGDKGDTAVKYHHLARIDLHKGTNLLVLKSNSEASAKTWAIIASIMSINDGTTMAVKSQDGYIIKNRLVSRGEPLIIDNPGLIGQLGACVDVDDSRSRSMGTSRCFVGRRILFDTNSLPDGYYSATMHVGSATIHDEFYIGSLSTVVNLLTTKRDLESSVGTQEKDVLLQRLSILLSAKYSHPENSDWQRKILLVVHDAIMSSQYDTQSDWVYRPGMHFGEYVSRIDGTKQYYLLYLPEGIHLRLPLVVDMPYAQNPERPFLESALAIGWPQALDDLKRAADEYGFAVAVINGRGNAGDSPIGEADSLEAVESISSKYLIDRQRLYLFGVCEGGRRALRLAEHYPGMFAAVGVYGPALGDSHRSVTDIWRRLFHQMPREQNLSGLANTPVKIVQGEFDDVPSKDTLSAYFEALKKVSDSSQMVVLHDGTHGTNASEKVLYPWFADHVNRTERSIDEATDMAIKRARY